MQGGRDREGGVAMGEEMSEKASRNFGKLIFDHNKEIRQLTGARVVEAAARTAPETCSRLCALVEGLSVERCRHRVCRGSDAPI